MFIVMKKFHKKTVVCLFYNSENYKKTSISNIEYKVRAIRFNKEVSYVIGQIFVDRLKNF